MKMSFRENRLLRPLTKIWEAWSVVQRHANSRSARRVKECDQNVNPVESGLREEREQLLATTMALDGALRPFLAAINLHTMGLEAVMFQVNTQLEMAERTWKQEKKALSRLYR